MEPDSNVKPLIGWREWVGLPELGIAKIKVKVDSGAQTSALHATHIEYFRSRGKTRVRFCVAPLQDTKRGERSVTAELVGIKTVKSSTGVKTVRPTIQTDLRIGPYTFPIKITLINRDLMGFRMLLGREAIRRRFLVDSGRSYLMKKAGRSKSRD